MESIEDIFKRMLTSIKEGSIKVKRTEVYGLIVSTVFTPDCGFETAILDKNGAFPVERYKSEEESIIGHAKWCKKAKTLKQVVSLNWLGLTEDETIILERNFDVNFK